MSGERPPECYGHSIPEHMQESAEWYRTDTYSGFSPEFYKEDRCKNCGQPIYHYAMDIIPAWRHFDHSCCCFHSPLAEPAASGIEKGDD